MNKVEFTFVKSHLKKAIYNLECANKLSSDGVVIDSEIIEELKILLLELAIKNGEKIVL